MPRSLYSARSEGNSAPPPTSAFLKRGGVLAGLLGLVEQDLQVVGHADVGRGLQVLDDVELLLGVAGAGGDDGAAERARPGVQDPAAGREVIGERVVDDVALAHAGGKQRARRAPPVLAEALGLEDRPGRHEDAGERCRPAPS